MNVLELRLDNPTHAFMPGQPLTGSAKWSLQRNATAIEISLVWFTRGKGTTNQRRVVTHRIDHPVAQGNQVFSFTLPPGPWSYSGRLVSLCWAVEGVIVPEKTPVRQEFIMAPGGVEIVLS